MNRNLIKQGFTIVELLIVIVVIAILAAISIVGYNGMKERANETVVKGDLVNNRKKLLEYKAINGRFPTTQGVANKGSSTCADGVQAGQVSASGTSYCPILSNGASSDYNNASISSTSTPDQFKLEIGKGNYAYSIDESGNIVRIEGCTKTGSNAPEAATYGYNDVYNCSGSITYSQ